MPDDLIDTLNAGAGVSRFYTSLKYSLGVLQGAQQALVDIAEKRRAATTEVVQNTSLSTAGKTAAGAGLKQKALSDIDALSGRMAAAYKDVSQQLQDATQGPARSTAEATLSEMQISRAWNRVKTALDSAKSDTAILTVAKDAAQEAAASGDAASVEALTSELPAYLKAKGLDPVEVKSDLAAAQSKFDNPVQGAARKLQGIIDPAWSRLQMALAYTKHDADTSETDSLILPGFDKGSEITIN